MIVDGIIGVIGKVKEVIDGVVSKICNFLLFLLVKEGFLFDLYKLNFGGMIVMGIYVGEIVVSRVMVFILDLLLLNDFVLDLVGWGNFMVMIDYCLENDVYNWLLFVIVELMLDGKVVAVIMVFYLVIEL